MKTKKRFLSILLTLALALGLMAGMSLTAYADDPYASLKNTTTVITFDGKPWYLIDYDASTVTLLTKECVAASAYNSSGSYVAYDSNPAPTVKSAVDTYYNTISDNAKTAVNDGKMFLLTTDDANAITNADVRKCSQYSGTDSNCWWLCSQGGDGNSAAFVNGDNSYVRDYGAPVSESFGVRPALKLKLSSVIFSSETKTFSLPVPVTGVSLNPSDATLTVGGDAVKLTATVTPSDATDKTVKWNFDSNTVALFSDADCTSSITANTATEILTVYAKGSAKGKDIIFLQSNADENQSARCEVMVAPTAAISPAGAGTVAFTAVSLGTDLQFTATANSDYVFDHWSWSDGGTKKTSTSNPSTWIQYIGNYNKGTSKN